MINFKFRGKVTADDYLKMVRRLTNIRNLVFEIAIVLVVLIVYYFIKTPLMTVLAFLVFAIVILVLNYFVLAPKKYQRMYEQNNELQREQVYDFYDGMTFAQPIVKVAYFDDAVYFYFSKNQAMILKKEWLEKPELWDAFQGFVKMRIDPTSKNK